MTRKQKKPQVIDRRFYHRIEKTSEKYPLESQVQYRANQSGQQSYKYYIYVVWCVRFFKQLTPRLIHSLSRCSIQNSQTKNWNDLFVVWPRLFIYFGLRIVAVAWQFFFAS